MAIFQGLGNKDQNQNQGESPNKGRVKSVLRYTMMPEILPRIRALGLHFGHFAYLLALVFSSARLIPQTHPVLNAANIGRYGVRQVIAKAANNITWSRNNIDQIAIFSAIVIGLIMIFVQALLIAVVALLGMNPAAAQTSFFENPDPANDPIIIFLAQVFGDLNGFWGSGFTDADGHVFGTPFHDALYRMLSLYSMAMMIIAVIIVLYYIMTVVGEAAKTGTPFGQRFNSLWAPIRLVVALGLLVPLGSGLNSAQYLTLWIAKAGSGLGTTVWSELATVLTNDSESYVIGDYQNDWVDEAAVTVLMMEICKHAENKYNPTSAQVAPVISEDGTNNTFSVIYEKGRGWDGEWLTTCGKASIKIQENDANSLIIGTRAIPFDEMYNVSRNIITRLIGIDDAGNVASTKISGIAEQVVNGEITIGGRGPAYPVDDAIRVALNVADEIKNSEFSSLTEAQLEGEISAAIQSIIDKSQESWAYAGVWYLELGRLIGASNDAQRNAKPNLAFGTVITKQHAISNGSIQQGPGFRDQAPVTKRTLVLGGVSNETRLLTNSAWNYYVDNKSRFIPPSPDLPKECEGLGDGGDESIFASAACAAAAMIIPDELTLLLREKDLDPMSTLINAGYSIFQKSWTYILVGVTASAVGSFLPDIIGGAVSTIGSLAILIGALGITAGFILYFLLPVLPFIYFFFAIVSWLMEIFEAVIAMPLWALAHLRIDGDGMPGQAAMNGYFLLLSILLRPALIVMGLIAGALVFHAAIFLLQTLFGPVLIIRGTGSSNGLEVLIYGIIFAYLCYSAGITSFKLVDAIPNQILRWIGNGTPTFSEGKEDPVSGNQQLLAAAGGFVGSSVANNLSQGASGIGKSVTSARNQSQADAVSAQRHKDMVDALGGRSGGSSAGD